MLLHADSVVLFPPTSSSALIGRGIVLLAAFRPSESPGKTWNCYRKNLACPLVRMPPVDGRKNYNIGSVVEIVKFTMSRLLVGLMRFLFQVD